MINDHPGNMNCRALEHSWIVPGTADLNVHPGRHAVAKIPYCGNSRVIRHNFFERRLRMFVSPWYDCFSCDHWQLYEMHIVQKRPDHASSGGKDVHNVKFHESRPGQDLKNIFKLISKSHAENPWALGISWKTTTTATTKTAVWPQISSYKWGWGNSYK